jgi:hypothetical protein
MSIEFARPRADHLFEGWRKDDSRGAPWRTECALKSLSPIVCWLRAASRSDVDVQGFERRDPRRSVDHVAETAQTLELFTRTG